MNHHDEGLEDPLLPQPARHGGRAPVHGERPALFHDNDDNDPLGLQAMGLVPMAMSDDDDDSEDEEAVDDNEEEEEEEEEVSTTKICACKITSERLNIACTIHWIPARSMHSWKGHELIA